MCYYRVNHIGEYGKAFRFKGGFVKILATDNSAVEQVKDEIVGSVGKGIEIKEYNRQRKLLHTYNGKIVSVYDNLFLVEVTASCYKMNRTFSYIDVALPEYEFEIK